MRLSLSATCSCWGKSWILKLAANLDKLHMLAFCCAPRVFWWSVTYFLYDQLLPLLGKRGAWTLALMHRSLKSWHDDPFIFHSAAFQISKWIFGLIFLPEIWNSNQSRISFKASSIFKRQTFPSSKWPKEVQQWLVLRGYKFMSWSGVLLTIFARW